MTALSHPGAVMARLEEIDEALAILQNDAEESATEWFRCKRDREKAWAEEYDRAEGSVEARKAAATRASRDIGAEEEGRWEGRKLEVKILEARANIGMSLLKSQGRA